MKKQVMNIAFDDCTMEEAVNTALTYIDKKEKCRVVTPNAEFALEAAKNPRFLKILQSSEMVLPDGISVIYAAKIVGNPINTKLPGVVFAQALCAALAERGGKLFLLGAKPGVAEKAGEKLKEEYSGLIIAGTHDGYFTDVNSVIAEINAAQADALFVCLGAPKQEYFMEEHRDELNVPLMAGLGGSLDVLAGNVNRAPEFYQKAGLEWFYRLCKEPKRWKRMIKLPIYLWDAVIWKIKKH